MTGETGMTPESLRKAREARVAAAFAEANARTGLFKARAGSNGWQPIGTAPRDGTEVLVQFKDKSVAIRCWGYVGKDCPENYGWQSTEFEGSHSYGDQHLAYWQPLPEPRED